MRDAITGSNKRIGGIDMIFLVGYYLNQMLRCMGLRQIDSCEAFGFTMVNNYGQVSFHNHYYPLCTLFFWMHTSGDSTCSNSRRLDRRKRNLLGIRSRFVHRIYRISFFTESTRHKKTAEAVYREGKCKVIYY